MHQNSELQRFQKLLIQLTTCIDRKLHWYNTNLLSVKFTKYWSRQLECIWLAKFSIIWSFWLVLSNWFAWFTLHQANIHNSYMLSEVHERHPHSCIVVSIFMGFTNESLLFMVTLICHFVQPNNNFNGMSSSHFCG